MNYQQHLLDNIDPDFPNPDRLPPSALLVATFREEYSWAVNNAPLSKVCETWLRGMPTISTLPFTYADLDQLGVTDADYWQRLGHILAGWVRSGPVFDMRVTLHQLGSAERVFHVYNDLGHVFVVDEPESTVRKLDAVSLMPAALQEGDLEAVLTFLGLPVTGWNCG